MWVDSTGILEIFYISLGVALWIATFDINYARMDVESDRQNGIHSFPSRFDDVVTTRTSIQLTLLWFACFAISTQLMRFGFLATAGIMSIFEYRSHNIKRKISRFPNGIFSEFRC